MTGIQETPDWQHGGERGSTIGVDDRRVEIALAYEWLRNIMLSWIFVDKGRERWAIVWR
jgi:hypothetical protein